MQKEFYEIWMASDRAGFHALNGGRVATVSLALRSKISSITPRLWMEEIIPLPE